MKTSLWEVWEASSVFDMTRSFSSTNVWRGKKFFIFLIASDKFLSLSFASKYSVRWEKKGINKIQLLRVHDVVKSNLIKKSKWIWLDSEIIFPRCHIAQSTFIKHDVIIYCCWLIISSNKKVMNIDLCIWNHFLSDYNQYP